MRPDNPLIVAVDRPDLDGAEALARSLSRVVGMLKVGLELFSAHGAEAVRGVASHGPVFLDLKLHDIPTTVGRAARVLARLGPAMLTVHALGGRAMVEAAVEGVGRGAEEAGVEAPGIIAVTVLSSKGGGSSPASLAVEAVAGGAAGVVVSGEDVRAVREALGDAPALVVPGIRPAGHSSDDHARPLTPREAVAAGADYLVVGRPITGAPDPAQAARAILAEVR